MALLSCVGEDILLPDELSCPEYEVTSDLDDRTKMQKNPDPTLVFESTQVNAYPVKSFFLIVFC